MGYRLQIGYQIWHHFGASWLGYRAWYALQQRTGYLKRQLPNRPWHEQPLATFLRDQRLAEPARYAAYRRSAAPHFFFGPDACAAGKLYFQAWDQGLTSPVEVAAELAAGILRYFEHTPATIGCPPQWHRNPFTGQTAPVEGHWSELSDFGYGDIKIIWEPSRFGFVYTLVRAYWRTGNEHYAEIFWQFVEDWRRHNPPQQGPNWKCGQETTFRIMAWCFGLYGFLQSPSTTEVRLSQLAQMIAVSGQRIAANIDYALSQQNNHSVSEAVGLWTIGLLFPEFTQAEQWRNQGRALLERLAGELIYLDGSFVQHSMNYHRVLLHDYLWALRLGALLDQPLSQATAERVGCAGRWLYQVQDPGTGRVPHYGQMDGALVLPLNNCDYLDFRPVIQAVHYLISGFRCYPAGPWDEDLYWLCGTASLNAPLQVTERCNLQATEGGYYTLRSTESFLFTRCATYRHRPGQADMLHVDVWWRGQNIALDPGTYSYNAPAPWQNPLAHTRYHNTVTVNDRDQMERVGKFLWLPWLQSRVNHAMPPVAGVTQYWEGEHQGYRRLPVPVRHRRALVGLPQNSWLVVDLLQSTANHTYRLHWLLADFPYQWQEQQQQMCLETAAGPYTLQVGTVTGQGQATVERAAAASPRGWQALYYFTRQPAISLDLTLTADQTCFWTLFGPKPAQVQIDHATWAVFTETWRVHLRWSLTAPDGLLTEIRPSETGCC